LTPRLVFAQPTAACYDGKFDWCGKDENVIAWRVLLYAGLIAVSASSGCADRQSSPGYWTATSLKFIQTTCNSQITDGSRLFFFEPADINARCFYFRGPFEVSEWLTTTSAFVYSNKILVDDIGTLSSRVVPGGLFMGEAPFPFQGLDGRLRTVYRLRNLHVRPKGEVD
jgi:hypothetical protein